MDKSDATIGQQVIVTGDSRGSGHGFFAGSTGEVLDMDANDALVRVNGATLWVYYADLSPLTDDAKALIDFKALVVEKAQAAASAHGWCEVVDGVLNDLGLGHLIPRKGYVDVTFRIKVEAPAGTSDYNFRDLAVSKVRESIKAEDWAASHQSSTIVE